MRLSLSVVTAVSLLTQIASAIFADEVDVIDWHHALVGRPRPDATFFHQPQVSSKASLLYTLSELNVLAAINPRNGSALWRQRLPGSTADIATLRAAHTTNQVVTGTGSEVTAWGAFDGRQTWSFDLGSDKVRDLEIVEQEGDSEDNAPRDILVLAQGKAARVLLLNGASGKLKWEHIDDSGDIAHQVSASTTQSFYISLHSGLIGSGLKVRVTALDLRTGKKTEQHTLSSDSEIVDANHVLAVGANSAFPIVAWTDKAHTVLKVNIIGTKIVATFNISPSDGPITDVSIVGPSNANSRPHFLVAYKSAKQSWADVYHVDPIKATVVKAYSLPKLGGQSSFSATSDGSNVYFTRITPSEISVVSSASHGILARWSLGKGIVTSDAEPLDAVTELSVRDESVSAARSAIFLSNGEWISVRDGTLVWTRPEELAYTTVAAYAYPPTTGSKGTTKNERVRQAENGIVGAYVQRWLRHLKDLEQLPRLLQELPSTILTSLGLKDRSASSLLKDLTSFGFHKVVVCITSNGRAVGIDTGARGRVLWSLSTLR